MTKTLKKFAQESLIKLNNNMKYITLIPDAEKRLRKDYIREHSKFIHSSWLLYEDLDKKVEFYDRTFTIAGLWDVIGHKKLILLKAENGTYGHLDSQEVAAALGYTRFRNLVTGKELTYDMAAEFRIKKSRNIYLMPTEEDVVVEKEIDEDSIIDEEDEEDLELNDKNLDDEDLDEDYEDEEEDPLIRSLRTDENDSGWIDDNEHGI